MNFIEIITLISYFSYFYCSYNTATVKCQISQQLKSEVKISSGRS